MPRVKNNESHISKLKKELSKAKEQLKKTKQQTKEADHKWKMKLAQLTLAYADKVTEASQAGFTKGLSEAGKIAKVKMKALSSVAANIERELCKKLKIQAGKKTTPATAKRRGRPAKTAKKRGRPAKKASA